MLTKHADLKLYDDFSGSGRKISVTPLFLQSQDEPWEPNEIFDVTESARLTAGTWEDHKEPLELGKIIVDDQKQWHFDGEGDLSENELDEIAGFVLDSD